jgi:hypothetical protein
MNKKLIELLKTNLYLNERVVSLNNKIISLEDEIQGLKNNSGSEDEGGFKFCFPHKSISEGGLGMDIRINSGSVIVDNHNIQNYYIKTGEKFIASNYNYEYCFLFIKASLDIQFSLTSGTGAYETLFSFNFENDCFVTDLEYQKVVYGTVYPATHIDPTMLFTLTFSADGVLIRNFTGNNSGETTLFLDDCIAGYFKTPL